MSKLTVTMPDESSIQLVRTFDAPRRLVIQAMTTPELVKRWLGGKRAVVTVAEIDARVGGAYRYQFRTHSGYEFGFTGTFSEISEDRVVFTEQFNDQPGVAIVTTTYREDNGITTMTVTSRFPNQEIRDMVAATGMADGAGESYDVLETLIAGMM